ncbi:S-layer homology domain-containing protein [Clostridium phoceensis]|uniref:S-layer homology domain-containing protein n=1 Tax=Clostridium phoceensis TaxID=1650661 RepID=UPI00067ED35D|nr:S-layer homology domain-containing protein [Clostridium phoceensis]
MAVTSAIGLFDGYEDGSFGPENVVTRAEMAVIISTMLYGAGVNVNQFAETNVFTDVPAWAQGYVNLCSSLGIVAGVGDGKFDPNATVTTAQAVLMLCRALGYFQNAADFGDNWMLAATAKGTALGLYGDLKLTANEGLTRDNVAELVFNALTKAVPVQYNELLGVYYNENKGIIYSLTFYYTDTLGYKNFDLVYKTNENTDYGRPGTTWGTGSYRGTSATTEGNDSYGLNEDGSLKPENVKMTSDDEIITVADTPDYVYTAGTKENVIYKDLGKTVVEGTEKGDYVYDWVAYVDGAEQEVAGRPENEKDPTYEYTDKGATTEIYVDEVNETVTVVKINYYLAEITDIRSDDDGEFATVRMLGTQDPLGDSVDTRKIYCKGFAEDDYVVVTVDVDEDGDAFVATINDPATAEGTVTRVKKDADPEEDQGNYVKLDDGNQYNYSKWTEGDVDGINEKHPTLDIGYRLFLDPNGYVIGFIALDDYYANYLYVDAVDVSLKTITAKVVFTDGTAKTVEIDDEYIDLHSDRQDFTMDQDTVQAMLEEHVFAWTVSDDVYTLRQILPYANVNDRDDGDLYEDNNYKDTEDHAVGNGNNTAAINSDKAFIYVNGTKYIVDEKTAFIDTDEKVLYTGFENVPDYVDNDATDPVKFWAIDKNSDGALDVVFVYSGEASNSNKTYFYVADWEAYESYDKNKMYKEATVYVDGEKTTLIFTADAHQEITTGKSGLYVVNRTNGSGVVTDADKIAVSAVPEVVGSRAFSLGDSNADQWTANSETIFVVATYELKNNGKDLKSSADVRVGDLKDMEEDDDYYTYAYVAKPDDSDDPAELVYIVKQEKSEYKAISLTVDGTAVSAAAATLKAGETYSYTYTAPDGKLIDTVAGIAAADYTVAADGKSVAISFKVKDKTDIAITLKNEPAAPETRTLTLKGNLIDPTLATVWTDASTEIEGTPIKEFGKVTAMEYKIPENATVTIMDSDITDVGTVRINGILIDTDAGELTFTMSDNLTLTGAPTTGAAVFTLTAGEGIVLKDADGNEITGPVASGTQVTVESETGYYLQDKVADATGVADTNKVTVTADTAVYAASKVELKQGAAATYGTSNTAVNDGNYVALGTELKVTAAGKSGVVVGTTGDAITTYVVTKDDVVLNGAWKVELTDVTATISGKAIGAYVADGQTLTATVATGAGTSVIEVKGNNKFATTAFTTGTVSADLELAAATSVKVGNGSGEVTYEGSNGKDIEVLAANADTTAYVMPGTVLTVKNAGTITGADDVTAEGVFQTFTVGTVAIEIENP